MKKKTIWLVVSCLMVAALLLASCAPAVTEKEEVPSPEEEKVVVTEEEEEAASPEGEAVTEKEEAVTEKEEAAPPEEEGAVTEEEEAASPTPTQEPEADIPIIDAHSQVCPENIDKVIELMDQAGVARTILSSGMTSTIGIVTPEELLSFASNYPGRIIPAVRIKVGKGENYYELLEKQMNMDGFGAMAEVLMYHALPPLIVAHPDDESVQAALNYALDKEWPFIAHIEFVAAGSQRDVFMTELKALLVQYPEHPFVLIHMGQLDHAAVRQLIEAHGNIYFITAASTPKVVSDSPWTNMFDGRNLSADWKQLMIDYPDRFIMGFDMVMPETWGQPYLGVVALWREAIKELPVEVAHAFAHGNAERLWHLPPVKEEAAPPEEEAVTEEEEAAIPTPTPPADTTPPSVITGLVACDAYDGRVNLWWDKSTAGDFAHYGIYVSQAEIVDASGMTPVHQITDTTTSNYQVTGLEEGTEYYFAVTVIDKSGNESTLVDSVSATPTAMSRGTADPDISVDVYKSDMVWAGTTLLPVNHNLERPRIIEVNMLGEIIWEYLVPESGFTEAELLSNNNILYTVSGKGVYEIDRNGKIVWSYLTSKVDHDADRLPNGNTIFVCADDQKSDAQVTEVNPKGEIVWQWYAKDYFDKPPYSDIISKEGHWTHTNAVTRMANGNTFISLRNFNLVAEVDPQGAVVKIHGEGVFIEVHDPEILPNGNILAASHDRPEERAVEVDPETGEVVWQSPGFEPESFPVRDANRLPNGNTLITASDKVVEVTPEGEIVWQLEGVTGLGPQGFYKADRISIQR